MADVISNEVLASQITSLGLQVNKLEAKLDAYATHFITAEVYELRHRELELKVNSIEMDLQNFRRSSTGKLWITSTLSAAGGIILAFLIQFYLSHVK